mgnify:CR=1 FL=1|jgi:hypothetical protein
MKLFELLQLLNTEIGTPANNVALSVDQLPPYGGSPVQIDPPAQPQQPAPVQPVSVAVAEQMDGPEEYNGIEQLLQQILNSQQSSAKAVSQLTSTLQAAQVGMGVQTQPAEDRALMATARIINPMFGKDVK